MKVLNLRLDAKTAAAVQKLRRQGVNVSELVRQALRDHAAESPKRDAADTHALIAELDRLYPVPDEAEQNRVDLTDRHAVSEFIRNRIAEKQKRIKRDLARHERAGRDRRSA